MHNGLAHDPRTMWAYRLFLGRRSAEELPEPLAAAVLGALGPEEHAEYIGLARVAKEESPLYGSELERSGARHLAVRTITSWFLVDTESGEVGPRLAQQGYTVFTSRATQWPDIGWGTTGTAPNAGECTFKTFIDSEDCVEREVLDTSAAKHIKRLPPSDLALPVPDLRDLSVRPAEPERAASLVTGWRSAEEAARAHMRANGFPDAELTGGGRDSGLDVVAGAGVAQVKMQALPVGAPAVQQLRGARPTAPHHLFYSTAGYTPAALAAGEEIGVALFTMGADGAVAATNAHARAVLLRSGAEGDSAEPARMTVEEVISDYAVQVRNRVHTASQNLDYEARSEPDWDAGRALLYLAEALERLARKPTFTSARAAIAHYFHAELLAIAAFRGLGVGYPDADGTRREPEPTLEDYYQF
jgi:hypothetical protein